MTSASDGAVTDPTAEELAEAFKMATGYADPEAPGRIVEIAALKNLARCHLRATAELARLRAPAAGAPYCWHCQVVLEPEPTPHCESCPAPGDCDLSDCREPGCLGIPPRSEAPAAGAPSEAFSFKVEDADGSLVTIQRGQRAGKRLADRGAPSEAVAPPDECPLCDGKGRLAEDPLPDEDRPPDSDDGWNASTADNYRAQYGVEPPRHLYNPAKEEQDSVTSEQPAASSGPGRGGLNDGGPASGENGAFQLEAIDPDVLAAVFPETEDDICFSDAALNTLERELAEKTARVAELEVALNVNTAELIKAGRIIRKLESQLAARPALELPTRDELARFLSQETEGDAWDDPLHDEHQERFRNAWRKKANRILAFLAPKPPEGRSDD
jgi:hypothetical protein